MLTRVAGAGSGSAILRNCRGGRLNVLGADRVPGASVYQQLLDLGMRLVYFSHTKGKG